METFFAWLAICAENWPVPGEFTAQRPVTRSFDVFFDLRLNKRLSKQSWGWWFETLSRPLWRHCNEYIWFVVTGCIGSCQHLQPLMKNSSSWWIFGYHDDVIIWNYFPRYWPFVRGNPPVTVGFPSQRPMTRNFDVFFDLCLNKRFSKQSWSQWFETPWPSLWRHCNDNGLQVQHRGPLLLTRINFNSNIDK